MEQQQQDTRKGPMWLRWTVGVVVIVLACIGFNAVVDKVFSAPAQAPAAATQQAPVCESHPSHPCKPTYVKKRVAKFKAGDLGNAKGIRMPRKIRRMLNQQAAAMFGAEGFGKMQQSGDDWWNVPFNAAKCLAYGGMNGGCDQTADTQRKIARGTVKATLKCAGNAAIGTFIGKKVSPKGGWWGLGIGTSTCLAGKIWDKATNIIFPECGAGFKCRSVVPRR